MDIESQQNYKSYHKDKKDIKKIDSLLVNVVKIFYDFYAEKNGWAYEIKDRNTVFDSPRNLSYSTCSMILHSILSALGKLPESNISKGIDPQHYLINNDLIEEDVINKLDEVSKNCFKEIIKKSHKNGLCLFNSKNFGLDDPFTYAWFLEFFIFFDHSNSEFIKSIEDFDSCKIKLIENTIFLLEDAFNSLNSSCLIWEKDKKNPSNKPLEHSFPLLKVINIYRTFKRSTEYLEIAKSILDNIEIERTLLDDIDRNFEEKIPKYTLDSVYKYLSLYEIKDSDFDVAELVFSLEAYLLSVVGKKNIDKNLLEKVFNTVEDRQKRSPYWRPLKPFVTTSSEFVLLPLSIEIVNSLLRICSIVAERDGDENFFFKYIGIFKRYLSWLNNRTVIGQAMNSEDKMCDFTGWHSENVLEPGKVHPWDTSQVLLFMLLYKSHMQKYISKKMIESSNFAPKRYLREEKFKDFAPHDYWKENWGKTEPLTNKEISSRYKALKKIGNEYISPRKENGISTISEDINCSMILYGTAGTGKSSIAEEIAKSLDWEMITITPSNFIAKGEAEVENRAKEIFDVLMEQEKCVVLFDEIDRLILDRDSTLYQNQSDIFQFMTPGMLVKIKDLRRKKNLIFIIATNYEDRIDPAIKRRGRIDHKYLIMPPDFDQRKRILKKLIKNNIENNKPSLIDKIKDVDKCINSLDRKSTFCKKTVLYIYGEIEYLAEFVVDKFKESLDKNPIEVIKCLKETLEDENIYEPPEITILSYRNRFECMNNGKEEKFLQIQEPFLEFLLLVFLKVNEHPGTKKERPLSSPEEDMFLNVVKSMNGVKNTEATDIKKEDVESALNKKLNDAIIVEKLLDTFFEIIESKKK